MRWTQRCHILAWTSLWIYIPAFISNQHWVDFSLLVLSGTFSLLHWTRNRTGDWRHMGDIAFGVLLAITLNYRLLRARRIVTCLSLGGIQCILFFSQRIAQMQKPIQWKTVTYIHLAFRYAGFWLAMAVRLPDTWYHWFGLTIPYIAHIFWLYK